MKQSRPASASSFHAKEPLKKDEEFWFEDGNLLLVARDVQFRVYQGPLVAHSPVFQDMLSLPQPAEDSVHRERHGDPSCPTVPLIDSPEDLRHFLRVFMVGMTSKTIRCVLCDVYTTICMPKP